MAIALATYALIDDVTYAAVAGAPDASDLDKLHFLANAASARMEAYTRRFLRSRDLTQYLDGTGTSRLVVPVRPINSITTLNADASRAFAAATDMAASEYRFLPDPGIIELFSGTFPCAIGSVKLVCNAGFAETHEKYPILQTACIELMLHNLKRFAGNVGVRSISGADGMNTALEIDMPLNVRLALDEFRDPA